MYYLYPCSSCHWCPNGWWPNRKTPVKHETKNLLIILDPVLSAQQGFNAQPCVHIVSPISLLISGLPCLHVCGDGASLSQPLKPLVGVVQEHPVLRFVWLCHVGNWNNKMVNYIQQCIKVNTSVIVASLPLEGKTEYEINLDLRSVGMYE